MYYIYSIHNGLFHKTYIGFTGNYNRRIVVHKSELKNGKHPCTEMQSDYNHSLYSNNNYMTYKLLAQHDNKEIAQGLEYLFLYKYFAHRKALYNRDQILFPCWLIEKEDDYANSFVDNRTILHAFFNGEFADGKFIRLCKILGKEELPEIALQ